MISHFQLWLILRVIFFHGFLNCFGIISEKQVEILSSLYCACVESITNDITFDKYVMENVLYSLGCIVSIFMLSIKETNCFFISFYLKF